MPAAIASAQPARPPEAAPAALAPVEPPRLLSDPGVPYPDGARGDATVIVVLVVGEDGSVRSVTSEGADEPFLTAAADAARTWRFDPATRDGKAISAKIKLAITFRAPVVTETPPESDPVPERVSEPGERAPKRLAPRPSVRRRSVSAARASRGAPSRCRAPR